MSKLLLGIIGVVAMGLVAGVIFLGTYRLPAPTQQIELQIPNDRLNLQ